MPIIVKLHSLSHASAEEQALVQQACDLLQVAVNDPSFPLRVRAASYRQTRYRGHDGRSISVPRDQIFAYIQNGLERGTEADQEIDLAIEIVDKPAGIVGSTVPGKLPIYTARWFIEGCVRENDGISAARHLLHEWLHVVGFYHYPNNRARKDVPYNLGAIVRAILHEQPRGDKNANTEIMADFLESSDCECAVDER